MGLTVRAGDLREIIEIQEPIEVRDGFGGVQTVWETVDTIWARAVTAKGDEALRAAATDARVTVRFQTRMREGVTPQMRLLWNGRAYDIRDVDETLRYRGELWITAVGTVR